MEAATRGEEGGPSPSAASQDEKGPGAGRRHCYSAARLVWSVYLCVPALCPRPGTHQAHTGPGPVWSCGEKHEELVMRTGYPNSVDQ